MCQDTTRPVVLWLADRSSWPERAYVLAANPIGDSKEWFITATPTRDAEVGRGYRSIDSSKLEISSSTRVALFRIAHPNYSGVRLYQLIDHRRCAS